MMANQCPKLSFINSYWPDLDWMSVSNPTTLARGIGYFDWPMPRLGE